jgi:hypothetical protein
MCQTQLTLLNLIIPIISGKEYKLCSFLQPPITSAFSGLNNNQEQATYHSHTITVKVLKVMFVLYSAKEIELLKRGQRAVMKQSAVIVSTDL